MKEMILKFFKRIIYLFLQAYRKYEEAVYVTKKQYKLKLLDIYHCENVNYLIANIQVVTKRVRAKFSLQYIANNKYILSDLHPIETSKVAFFANLERNGKKLDEIPGYYFLKEEKLPIIKQPPVVHIKSEEFDFVKNETIFHLMHDGAKEDISISAFDLLQKHELLYGMGSINSAKVGYCASEDLMRKSNTQSKLKNINIIENRNRLTSISFKYYHILCVAYVGLLISGISIVSRLFPFHIYGTHITIPLCAGMIFYPLTFFVQDVTTEVYGYSRSRQMVWLAVIVILFYVLYTQIAIHLPSGNGAEYSNNKSYTVVFEALPRQLLSLIISLLIGNLTNDYFLSKSKIIFAGQYLWARVLGSTMIGEAVLQIVGNIIGFSGTMNLSQLIPNTIFSYSYKLVWNLALIPIIYLITNFLKRSEGINIFDYNVNYNPFIFSILDGDKIKSINK